MTVQLNLKQKWVLGDRIGEGGFGQVFIVQSSGNKSAVAKLVPKVRGAQRELLFVDLTGVRNVVPIIDSGETEDSWVLIMPRAEKSLRQHLEQTSGGLNAAAVLVILSDIAVALVDLSGKVVHRDLKPENVLLLNGTWCLADFGISRYTEATTAPDTRKFALSPPYAAPERWRAERATIAADVYSFGVIAFEMLSASRPFPGPELEDFREQHLHGSPPNLANVPASLAALVEECLYKAPAGRPTPSNLQLRLRRIGASPPPIAGLAKLQEANRAEVIRRGEAAVLGSANRSESERRSELAAVATSSWKRMMDRLKEAISHAASSGNIQSTRDGEWSVDLNQAKLELAPPVSTAVAPWGAWQPPVFDVIAHSAIGIRIAPDRYGYEGRSHSLWYCDAKQAGQYQWFETAFMVSALIPKRAPRNPFALSPGEESAKALWTGLSEFQLAWPFLAIDVDDLEEFIGRWASWFADAAQGHLQHPTQMPERSAERSWRRT